MRLAAEAMAKQQARAHELHMAEYNRMGAEMGFPPVSTTQGKRPTDQAPHRATQVGTQDSDGILEVIDRGKRPSSQLRLALPDKWSGMQKPEVWLKHPNCGQRR